MKNRLFSLLMLLCLCTTSMLADDFINLTPRPRNMVEGTSTLTLPASFTVGYTNLPADMVTEVERFVTVFTTATGLQVTAQSDATDALIKVSLATSNLGDEGYNLSISTSGVSIEATTAHGLYYAFQSIRKVLPAHVMAGVPNPSCTSYVLPCFTTSDAPRYAYRGFMLDVSRHFFSLDDVKRMIDVMSYYKMNKFHWHLSDDQGWRVEIKKYPKLTSVGSIAPNSRFTDMYTCSQYWINEPYGPYFYTQDEIRDVVAYAKERHIEIIPEIDMPGHFCAAMTSYPEFSCYPNGNHTIWDDGGISSDIMNVANPAAVQFAKDILSELIDMFPYEYIHIGGDECPDGAWRQNAECQQMYEDLNLTHYRQLQSHFIAEMAEFVKSKDRKLAVWNESITAEGADLDLIKQTGATVYCWTGPEAAAQKAASLGLPNIYTPWGPYYINRKQGNGPLDPPGAGDGSDHVRKTYNTVPPSETDLGVQGTFWTEHVSDRDYMEWLALPRLIAVAEAGWTPQSRKDFADFQKRMTADTLLLQLGDYKYCNYYMLTSSGEQDNKVMPKTSTAEKKYYYRLISGGTDNDRRNRCIELLADGSPLIEQYTANGAQAGRLWTNAQAEANAANYDYQWWMLEEDANNPGHYALVCKALPEGSVSPEPTAISVSGRWVYDATQKHYNIVLGSGAYGTIGNNYYYSIESDTHSGQYFNSSMPKQGLAVNVYNAPNDGAGGQWQFAPAENYDMPAVPEYDHLVQGKTYLISNAVEGYNHTALCDNGTATLLQHSTDAFAHNAWTVTEATDNADGTQTLKLQNAATQRYVGAAKAYAAKRGCAITMSSTAAEVTLAFVPEHNAFRLLINGKSFFPISANSTTDPATISSGANVNDAAYDAPASQGAEWLVQAVKVHTIHCATTTGDVLGSYTLALPEEATALTAERCPAFKNMTVKEITSAGEAAWNVVYDRSAYAVVLDCRDERGAIVQRTETSVPVGGSYTVALPELKYYTLQSADQADGTVIKPTADLTLQAVYTTDALSGVKEVAGSVTELVSGHSYLLYDASTDAQRVGYRLIQDKTMNINRSFTATGLTPAATWTLLATGDKMRVKNEYYNLYVPALARSQSTTASAAGGLFTFTLNADGETFNVKGTNNMYWDGKENGDLVGWDGGTGHNIRVCEYHVQPYFTVTLVCKDTKGNELSKTQTLHMAGAAHTIIIPNMQGYTLQSVKGNEDYTGTVEAHMTIEATFLNEAEGIGSIEAEASQPSRQGIYDLQGRRLHRVPAQGIYIINGVKTYVK